MYITIKKNTYEVTR